MNRTLQPTQPAILPATHSSITAWPKTRRPSLPLHRHDSSARYSLFSPVHYEAGYAYPLVVWLHGPCSSELEICQVMPHVSTRNFVGIAPRGTVRESLAERRFGWEHTPSAIAESCQRVRHCIEAASNHMNIHKNRIFVAGYGEGGTMALRIGMEHPELFAGAASLGGRVPRGSHAFRRINAARRLPLMLSVSPVDGEFSKQEVLNDLRLLHSGGFSLSLNLYPEGDSLTDAMLSDLNSWMMAIVCPSSVESLSQ